MSGPFNPGADPSPPSQGQSYVLSTVTSGDVTLNEDNNALYLDDGTDDRAVWTDFRCTNYYEFDGRKYLMALTSPYGFLGRKAAVVQLAEPTLLLVSEWTACRFWEKPDVPDPTSLDLNWDLLDALPVTEMHGMAGADMNTPLWRISGVYVYACLNPDPLIYRNVVFPRPPYIEDVFDRTMPLTKLKQGINNTQRGFINGGVGVSLDGFLTRGS